MHSSIEGQAFLASFQPICSLCYLHSSEWVTHRGALAWNNIMFIVESSDEEKWTFVLL